MRNAAQWQPSKFEYRNGRLTGTRDKRKLAPASQLIASEIAKMYAGAIPQYASGDLLDLGCGLAPLYGAYAPYVASVTCVDWGKSPHSSRYLDCQCDIAKPLPFAADVFDTVILSDVLEHISDPLELYDEIHRVLRPGGRLLMNVPFYYPLHETPHDFFRYTEFALLHLAQRTGLRIIDLRPTGGLAEVWIDLTSKALQLLPVIGRSVASLVQRIGMSWLKLPVARRLRRATERAFPLGYFMVCEKQLDPQHT